MARTLREIGFVHLHVHSSYSLLEGALKIGDLGKLAAADGQPALALTDTNNLFGALEFSEKLIEKGIQPIAGLQLSVVFEEPEPSGRVAPPISNVVLLAQSDEGYGNLMRLASAAYFDVGLGDLPRVTLARLRNSAAGLIALTGGLTGPLDTALRTGGRVDLAEARSALPQTALVRAGDSAERCPRGLDAAPAAGAGRAGAAWRGRCGKSASCICTCTRPTRCSRGR